MLETVDSPEDFLKIYEKALASHDCRVIAPLIHDDCVVVFSDGTFSGKREVLEAFNRTFQKIKNEEYSISNIFWLIQNNDVATALFDFSWMGMVDCQQRSGGGRGSSTLIQESGCWKLLLEHLGPHAKA